MDPLAQNKKLEPGVYQGSPETSSGAGIPTGTPRLIRTMKLDMAEAVKNQHETSVSIAIAEEKKRAIARAEVSTENKNPEEKNISAPKRIGRLMVVIVLLLILAVIGFAYVFILPKIESTQFQFPKISFPFFNKATIPITITETLPALAPSIIPAQSEKKFNISTETPEQIYAVIREVSGVAKTAGSIENLYFTETVGTTSTKISSNRLFSFSKIQSPDILTRALDKDFMTGFLGDASGNATPFLVLNVYDHNAGLAGMLAWEPTLLRDFGILFGATFEAGVSDKFHDIVINGNDARILTTPSGKSILYSFANQNVIVITIHRQALESLLSLAPISASR